MTQRERLLSLLERFPDRRVLVVGDLMADEHLWGHAARVSPEAPVLVIEIEDETFVPGGAANVANQLLHFGARVAVAGVVGDDSAGAALTGRLREMGADISAVVVSADRPTTRKTRILAGSQQNAQQVVRVDREKRDPLPEKVAAELIRRTVEAMDGCDAVLFSDYVKGVLTRRTVSALAAEALRRRLVVTANPKPTSVAYFRDADIVQLNRFEADQASRSHRFESLDEAVFHEAGKRLRETLSVRNLLVTRGPKGLTVFTEEGGFEDVPPHRVEVYDGTGAGDSTIAGVTLGLAAGGSILDAVRLGNAAGGAVVRRVGVVAAPLQELASLL